MKLAVVVQRYGAQINGGAELHARYIVELLSKQHQVDVLTTCARDYVTWRDEWPEGAETVRGITVRRFRVSRERDPEDFGRRSTLVFDRPHSLADELAWLESEGPTCPALLDHLRAHERDYDYIFFFSYRYYQAYHGIRAVSHKAILVPTAERDAAIGLSMFGPIFRGARAIMYNSPEERAMIQAASGNSDVPGVVVGVGSDVPRQPIGSRFRRKFRITNPFIIYVGRIDANKGCAELFTFFTNYRPRLGQQLDLVLIGNSILPIPEHPRVHHLGFVSDQDKFDAMAAADALVMPSYYESLSMVTLEAWALGRPVLANGRCNVLRGQCIRSRAGLYYEGFEEFAETLFTLTTNRPLAEGLGENGRAYFEQHYAWPVIERKYQDMLKRLADEDAAGRQAAAPERLPGWLMRRRKVLPPAADLLKSLPDGAATGSDAADDRRDHHDRRDRTDRRAHEPQEPDDAGGTSDLVPSPSEAPAAALVSAGSEAGTPGGRNRPPHARTGSSGSGAGRGRTRGGASRQGGSSRAEGRRGPRGDAQGRDGQSREGQGREGQGRGEPGRGENTREGQSRDRDSRDARPREGREGADRDERPRDREPRERGPREGQPQDARPREGREGQDRDAQPRDREARDRDPQSGDRTRQGNRPPGSDRGGDRRDSSRPRRPRDGRDGRQGGRGGRS